MVLHKSNVFIRHQNQRCFLTLKAYVFVLPACFAADTRREAAGARWPFLIRSLFLPEVPVAAEAQWPAFTVLLLKLHSRPQQQEETCWRGNHVTSLLYITVILLLMYLLSCCCNVQQSTGELNLLQYKSIRSYVRYKYPSALVEFQMF